MSLASVGRMTPSDEAPGARRENSPSEVLPSVRVDGAGGVKASSLPPHFLSRLAHDIRSPLGLLSGALEEIREDLDGHLSEGHERMLSLAQRGLARLERMARTLSTVAQIESGDLGLQRVPVDLVPMLRKVVEQVEAEDPRRGLSSELALPTSCTTPLDPERMHEALWELVSQARRQAKSAIRVSLEEHAGRIEVRVEDDGRGLPADQKKYAFDRFYEPEDRRGTGLGLSIARDLVRAHGGDIELVDSTLPAGRPGTIGAGFVVTLSR